MNRLLDKLGNLPFPQTEYVAQCALCGSSERDELYEAFDRLHHLPGRFGIVRCNSCSLVRLSPRPLPEHLSYYYPEEDYYSYQALTERSSIGFIDRFRSSIRKAVLEKMGYPTTPLNVLEKIIQPAANLLFKSRATYGWGDRFPMYVPNGRVLDVGCGSGIYLSQLKALGWAVSGIEISSKAAAVAKEQYGIDVFCGQPTDAPFEDESFDHIHINHALEHFPDPFSVLKKVKTLLKPNGTLYIEVPNVESYGAAAAGPYWLHWDAPRHLFGFTPRSLEKSIVDAGLEVRKMTTILADFREWEDTYRLEEEKGEMLNDRPIKSFGSKLGHIPGWLGARMAYGYDKTKGDFLCCWASRKQNGVKPAASRHK